MHNTPNLAILPDSSDARLLTELSSYLDDLSDAAASMNLAIDAGTESPLWMPLTSYAVVAYMRAFGVSSVRPGIGAQVEIPRDLKDTHELLRVYRNTTIAHSQSELSLSLPLAKLTEGRVHKVLPVTVRHVLPENTATKFSNLIERVTELVESFMGPVAERLRAEYATADAETIAKWPIPEVQHQSDERFSADSRRGIKPRFTLYWNTETYTLAPTSESTDSQD